MIKAIFKTMFGLVVVFVAFLALINPFIFIGVFVVVLAYYVGKSMLG